MTRMVDKTGQPQCCCCLRWLHPSTVRQAIKKHPVVISVTAVTDKPDIAPFSVELCTNNRLYLYVRKKRLYNQISSSLSTSICICRTV